jgi:hypothetical protein
MLQSGTGAGEHLPVDLPETTLLTQAPRRSKEPLPTTGTVQVGCGLDLEAARPS